MKIYILILVILFIGCTTPITPICTNNLTIINNTIIREITKDCPTCDVCVTPDYSSYVKQVAESEDKLRFCHIQQDMLNQEIDQLRRDNTSDYMDELKGNYSNCVLQKRVCENKLGNITESLK